MSRDSLSHQAEAIRQLLSRIGSGEGDELEIRQLADSLLGQLCNAFEELQVITEELQSQKEELDTVRAAVRVDQDHYYNLFYHAPDAYLVTDSNTLVREANAEAQRMFRLPAGQGYGTPLIDFVPLPEKKEFIAAVARAKGRKTPHSWEMTLCRADGTRFPSDITAMVARDPEGRPVGLHWMVRDRTEIEETEQLLKQRLRIEELIASISHRFIGTAASEIATELEWALGTIGEFTGSDRCMLILLSGDDVTIGETHEWCPDQADAIDYYLTGTSLKGFTWLLPKMVVGEQVAVPRPEALPDGAAAERQFLQNIGAKGFVATPLILSGQLDGIFLVTHRRARKWTEAERSLFGTAGDLFVHVITRKRNVDALMESEQKFRTLFENYLNPIIIAGDDGRLTDANIAAIDFLERRPDDLKERQVRELLPGFDPVSLQAPERITRRTIETEYTIHGGTRNLLVQVVPLMIRNRTILYGIAQDITLRKQTEQLVRDQKTFLETILRAAADGIVVCDAQGKYLYLNDAAYRIAGVSPGTAIDSLSPSCWGKAFRKGGRPIPRENWTLEKALRGAGSVGEEVHMERPDGSSYDLLISSAPVQSSSRKIIGAVATFRDITDRKRVEKEIHEQKIFLEAILAEAADPIVVCDEQGNYLYINQAAFRMGGIDPARELEGVSSLSWGTAYDSEGKPIPHDQMVLERALRGESVVGLESRIERPDGSVYHILISAAPVRSQTQRIIGAVATFRDITKRKQAEEQLRETTDFLENLLTNANAPIVVWDPGFRITRFNRAFEHITGCTEGGMRGRDVRSLFSPHKKGQSPSLVERAAAGDRWESVEIPVTHEDGTVRIVLWNSANIISPEDQLIATIAQGQDITERKQAEMRVAENEAKLRVLFEALPIGIFVMDGDRNVIWVNSAMERISGSNRDELLRNDPGRFTFIRADGSRISVAEIPSVRELDANQAVQDIEMGIVKEDGSMIWANVSAQILPLPEWRVVITVADITWRKQAEHALKESEVRFRHLATFTQENPAPIIEVHPDGVIAFANIATGLALRRQGLPEKPEYFFPIDMEIILSELRKGVDAFYYREVPVGDAVFGESIYLSSAHKTVRIYAQDVTVYRRNR